MAYKSFGEQIDVDIDGDELKRAITNRGYTGHEHIEGTGLIHMNARVYDPTIGRFLSADTIIQDPYDTQSFNRYSYVRNNPMKYTDPTGHLFSGIGKWVSKNWQQVATVSVVVAVGVMTGGMSIVAQGAAMGFAGGFVGTALGGGSFADAMRNGMIGGIIGGVTAGFANQIGALGETIGGNLGLATRVGLHGGLQSFMSKAQGGSWSSGFWSGSLGTLFGQYTQTKSYEFNVAANAAAGGVISQVTGGKFANGAIMAAYRYMFTDVTINQKSKSLKTLPN